MNEREKFKIASDDSVIDAAQKLADLYADDDREFIKTDVMNAFYAGVKFARASQPAQEPFGYYVYVKETNNAYFVDDLDDAQSVDDATNNSRVITKLYTTPPSEAARIAELEAKLAVAEKDAERYRFLKPNYAMANFDIYEAEHKKDRVCGVIFEMPNETFFSANIDDVLDRLIADKG